MDDIVSTDPRDAFLIMLNDRVGELETQMHSINSKLDKLLDQFCVVSSDCVVITLGLTSEVPLDNWFKKETDRELAQLIYNTCLKNTSFEIEKIYIHHYSDLYNLVHKASKEVSVYLKFKRPYVYSTIEPLLRRFDLFKESRGCYIRNYNNCSESVILSTFNVHNSSVFDSSTIQSS